MAFAECRPFRREKLVFKLLGADNLGVTADGWACLHVNRSVNLPRLIVILVPRSSARYAP